MPRTAYTPVPTSRTPATPANDLGAAVAVDVANGNSVVNSGRTVLIVKNTNAGSTARSVTVTFNGNTVDGQLPTARVTPVPAGKTWVFGPYDPANYGTSLLVNGDNAELVVQVVEIASQG